MLKEIYDYFNRNEYYNPELEEATIETGQLLYGLIHARYILTPAGEFHGYLFG